MTLHPLVRVLVVLLPACCVADRMAQVPLHAASPLILMENSKPGTTEWQLTNPGLTSGIIEGYASLTSVNRGGQIQLFVNTGEPTYTIDIFRVGYYGGLGARRMMPTISRAGRVQIIPSPAPVTGLVECDWADPYVLNIPNSADATDWMSGIYLAKLTAGVSGKQQYIIFAVRDDARFTDLIMAQSVNTYQAYNPWGGKSLYGTIAKRDDTANKATKVSFNRPYFGEQTSGVSEFFYWEAGMARWLESQGYDVSYATNVDVDRDPNLLIPHKAFLSVGHDEYWSWNMRDHVESARDSGVNLGFFSGNASYWQVRLEPSVVGGQPARTLVGYKERWAEDPITPDYLKTNQFRLAPVNRPEDAMIGVRFVTQARTALVVEDASHWVFSGTGLKNGDRLTKDDGSTFIGYEVDAMGPSSPANAQRQAHSPVTPAAAYFSDMTTYRAPSGATVFATGSIGWSQTIPQVVQMTRNVLARFTTGAFAETTPVRAVLLVPFSAQDIGDVGRQGFVSLVAGPQSFTLNGAGREMSRTDDAMYYAYQMLSGDGQITVRLNALQHFWNNRAGVMIRESLAPNARYAALVSRPTLSASIVFEGAELRVRTSTGAMAQQVGSRDQAMPNWLRLARTGNTFSAFISADGSNWLPVATATVAMNTSVLIGASVASAQYGVWTTASFDNVSVGATSPPSCGSVALDRTSFYAGGPEANWSVSVSTPAGCGWTAVSDSPWLVVRSTAPSPPIGSGTVQIQALS
ncbi:MAG TPA: N,N-dimethylformamidase beta subunit family domain-containing protein, partial [Vicinamibacterales bacterium]|nr:N,N-dimethylformamidase beta subunit family domain-containing protein [Vicinamibacterales bacterium]